MNSTEYDALFRAAREAIGAHTPLSADCGVLCGHACCKGSDTQGMRLFPGEVSPLPELRTADGGRLAVCSGQCDRTMRPLACMIFPFFPVLHDGPCAAFPNAHARRITVEYDARALRLCPLILHRRNVRFDPEFLRGVRRAGRVLTRDPANAAFLREVSAEISAYRTFYGFFDSPSRRSFG